MGRKKLVTISEYEISSIYSFIHGDTGPVDHCFALKALVEMVGDKNLTYENIREDNVTGKYFPFASDEEDIYHVLDKWEKERMNEDEYLVSEYVDDGNLGYIRVVKFLTVGGKHE